MTHTAIIRGLGYHVPERGVTNADLEKLVETSDEWITTRTGIKKRHYAAEGETSTDLALKAARKALADAGMEAEALTHILVPTITPDEYCPNAACTLEHKLGIRGTMAMDINAACSGFVYGLQTARALIALQPDAKVLVAAAEVLTTRVNFEDRSTCVLFGDGAGAAVLTGGEPGEGDGVLCDCELGSDGAIGGLLRITGGGSSAPYKLGEGVGEEFFVRMEGREVYKHAVRNMTAVSKHVLSRNDMEPADLDLLIPHQANLRIIEAVGRKLGVPEEKVFVNVDRYGNTSAASCAIALAEAKAIGAIKPGMKVLLTTFGGGFTWGSGLMKF